MKHTAHILRFNIPYFSYCGVMPLPSAITIKRNILIMKILFPDWESVGRRCLFKEKNSRLDPGSNTAPGEMFSL